MTPTPKQLFQKTDKESAAQLAIALSESWLQKSLTAALAQIASSGQAEYIAGANHFVRELNALAADDAPPKKEPDPTLPSYGI